MRHEKILKRSNGNSINICVQCFFQEIDDKEQLCYLESVSVKMKGKKVFRGRHEDEGMFPTERATQDEIYTAKLELWEKLKPKM